MGFELRLRLDVLEGGFWADTVAGFWAETLVGSGWSFGRLMVMSRDFEWVLGGFCSPARLAMSTFFQRDRKPFFSE